jgi:hypothetical protein
MRHATVGQRPGLLVSGSLRRVFVSEEGFIVLNLDMWLLKEGKQPVNGGLMLQIFQSLV